MAVLGNRVIKSIQRGNGALVSESSESVTITEIDLNKTFVNILGPGPMRYSSSTNLSGAGVYFRLTNSTTLYVDSTQSVYRLYYSWEIVEYE